MRTRPFISLVSLLSVAAASANELETLLFDAPATLTAHGLVASAGVFSYYPHPNASKLDDVLERLVLPLQILGVERDAAFETARDRLRLFAGAPKDGQVVSLGVDGCSDPVQLGPTDETGMSVRTVQLAQCSNSTRLAGSVAGGIPNANAGMTVFPSPDGGWGVISDIDDTIKISHVLHKLHLLKTTLFDTPGPVPGMPALYANLSLSLHKPSFTFITGSPFQLVQFLHAFIRDTYSASQGPILARNLTLDDYGELDRFIFDVNSTEAFKLTQIQRLYELWPNKAFLTIGDSGERDPETYGAAYRTYGSNFVRCIWIRRLPDPAANNSEARFAAAFYGVPPEKFRVYSDDDIMNVLPGIDVAGGSC